MKKGWCTLLFLLFGISAYGSQITIVGCGYVGLTLAAVLGNAGHTIVCVDIDSHKVDALKNRQLPIYEPKLRELLFGAADAGAVVFVDDLQSGRDADIFYICVPTPTDKHGRSDCSFLFGACADVIRLCADAQ